MAGPRLNTSAEEGSGHGEERMEVCGDLLCLPGRGWNQGSVTQGESLPTSCPPRPAGKGELSQQERRPPGGSAPGRVTVGGQAGDGLREAHSGGCESQGT